MKLNRHFCESIFLSGVLSLGSLVGISFLIQPLEIIRRRLGVESVRIPSELELGGRPNFFLPSSHSSEKESKFLCIQISPGSPYGTLEIIYHGILEEGRFDWHLKSSRLERERNSKVSRIYAGSVSSSILGEFSGYWEGEKSLYRGFWCRFAIQ